MMSWSPFVTVLFAVVILLVGGAEYAQYKRDTRRIRLYLLGRGATDIAISKVWFEGDDYHNVYDVTYINGKCCRRQNRCIIQSGFSFDRPIYWKDDISS